MVKNGPWVHIGGPKRVQKGAKKGPKRGRFTEEIVLKIAHFWGIFGKFFEKNGQKRGYFKWRWTPTFQKVKQIYKPTGPMSNLCFPIGSMSISSRDGPVERFSGAKILSDL